ncbi:RIKEN cDNA 4930544M13 [Mus musculus]|nr:RIKEN cDNA 4930544M13 [Mus musculus]
MTSRKPSTMKIQLYLLPDCRSNMTRCLTFLSPGLPSMMDQAFKLRGKKLSLQDCAIIPQIW